MRATFLLDAGYATFRRNHVIVRSHPETRRKALYVNGGAHRALQGYERGRESVPRLRFLFAHLQRPEFICGFRWEVGSIAFWDNRCTQHNPINDYHGYRSMIHRVTVGGDKLR